MFSLYLLYPLAFFYQVYAAGYKAVYGIHPVFIDDWILIREVLPVFLHSVGLATVVNAVFLAGGVLLCIASGVWGIRRLFRSMEAYRKWRWWWAPMTGLFALTAISTLGFSGYLETDLLNIPWLAPKIRRSGIPTNVFHAHYSQIQTAYGPGLKCQLREKKMSGCYFWNPTARSPILGKGLRINNRILPSDWEINSAMQGGIAPQPTAGRQ
ncbi:MAG: hypothetical protein IPI11_01000 [Haliscomenobacter sp.]|nr:hypothetical protein [Haliscomenobacter sp.]